MHPSQHPLGAYVSVTDVTYLECLLSTANCANLMSVWVCGFCVAVYQAEILRSCYRASRHSSCRYGSPVNVFQNPDVPALVWSL